MGNSLNCFKKRNQNEDLNRPLINRIEKEYQSNFKEYFNMIQTKVNSFYKENQSNQFNISISLDKKDFQQLSVPKKLKLNPSEKFIYWKDYLLEYLNKHLLIKKESWVHEVIQKIDEEIFLKENKWLSLFFWQEFELRTRPVALTEDIKNINSNSPPIEERLRFNSNFSEKFHSSFASMKSDANPQSFSEQQYVYKDYKKKVKSYIKIFTQHIKDPEHPINIISNHFINAFSKWLKKIISEIRGLTLKYKKPEDVEVKLFQNNDYVFNKQDNFLEVEKEKKLFNKINNVRGTVDTDIDDNFKNFRESLFSIDEKILNYDPSIDLDYFIKQTYAQVVKSLQKFILKLQTSLRLMYAKTINYQCFIEEKDEFINLVCGLIFANDEIYDCIYELYKINFKNEYSQLNSKLDLFCNISPEELSIKPQFCLNHKTIELQESMSKKKKIKLNKPIESSIFNNKLETVHEVENESVSKHGKFLNIDTIVITDESITKVSPELKNPINSTSSGVTIQKEMNGHTRDSILTYNGYTPYFKAIESLKSLNEIKTPLKKMLLIANISTEITEAINEAWADIIPQDTSLLDINADELMAIFIYIIMRSKMPELVIHLNLIREFTTTITRNSMVGYYYTTMEAAIIYINSLKDKSDLLELKDRCSVLGNKTLLSNVSLLEDH